jgi:hypothetical protein
MGPRTHRRDRRHRAHPVRLFLIGFLAIATIGVGAWWLLGRDSSSSTATDFTSVETRFAAAAAAVHETPGVAQRFRELERFNAALDAQAVVMQQSLAEFDRIAHEEEGDAADIARDATVSSQRALRAVSAFRDAIVTTFDLTDAQKALDRIDAAVVELDASLKRWQQL